MPFDLSEDHILKAEASLGVRLPDSYRTALQVENGGQRKAAGDTCHEEIYFWNHENGTTKPVANTFFALKKYPQNKGGAPKVAVTPQ